MSKIDQKIELEQSPPEGHSIATGETEHSVVIRQLQEQDRSDLRAVMESVVRNPVTGEVIKDEVEEILASMKNSLENPGTKTYFVAQTPEGRVVGMMGLQPPGDVMRQFTTTPNPIEIINAYVLSDQRGTGIGHELVNHLEEEAKNRGYTEIVLNSGPRYRFSGWPFWRRKYGEPAGVAEKFYDGEWDAMVWRKDLTDQN